MRNCIQEMELKTHWAGISITQRNKNLMEGTEVGEGN